jgi:hypothetical protein
MNKFLREYDFNLHKIHLNLSSFLEITEKVVLFWLLLIQYPDLFIDLQNNQDSKSNTSCRSFSHIFLIAAEEGLFGENSVTGLALTMAFGMDVSNGISPKILI